jgi:hypothetical protein
MVGQGRIRRRAGLFAKEAAKAVARKALWPVRRIVDPRIQGLATLIQADMEAHSEATALMGESLTNLTAMVEEIHRQLVRDFERMIGGSVEDVDPEIARLLDYASSHVGYAAQEGLWFNPPVSLIYEAGSVRLAGVNERILEPGYAFRALAEVPPGSSILDVGATESTVALSLASLGFEVTAIDPRPYPLAHPRLRVVVGSVQDWDTEDVFAATLCLSTIEHVGLGAYGEPVGEDDADVAALHRIRELTRPNGLLILTTRYGQPGKDSLERTYDQAGLEKLLEGWKVENLTIAEKADATTWTAGSAKNLSPGAEAVALVTARRVG